jgi:hypothetical protein
MAANFAKLPEPAALGDVDRAWAILFGQNKLGWPSTTAPEPRPSLAPSRVSRQYVEEFGRRRGWKENALGRFVTIGFAGVLIC